jgi:D-glycero-D-manno-heptose 1,7-bisphosphate phosphatase
MGVNQVNGVSFNLAVFLDRDGVINNAVIRDGKPYPPTGLAEVSINPGVEDGLNSLRKLGYLLIVVTNQPDFSRGRITRESVEAIHTFLLEKLPLNKIMVCYHDNHDQCDCRKPKPGHLLEAATQFNIDLTKSYMVGDRWSDVEAGKCAGCKTIFIDNGYIEQQPDSPDFSVRTFSEAIEIIRSTAKIRGNHPGD